MQKFLFSIAICTLLSGCLAEPSFTPLTRATAPDGQHTVTVRANEAWWFGPHTIQVSIVDFQTQMNTLEYRVDLYNDGANLGSRNVEIIDFDDEFVFVCMRGQEQPDTMYQFTLAGGKVVIKEGC